MNTYLNMIYFFIHNDLLDNKYLNFLFWFKNYEPFVNVFNFIYYIWFMGLKNHKLKLVSQKILNSFNYLHSTLMIRILIYISIYLFFYFFQIESFIDCIDYLSLSF